MTTLARSNTLSSPAATRVVAAQVAAAQTIAQAPGAFPLPPQVRNPRQGLGRRLVVPVADDVDVHVELAAELVDGAGPQQPSQQAVARPAYDQLGDVAPAGIGQQGRDQLGPGQGGGLRPQCLGQLEGLHGPVAALDRTGAAACGVST